jgi:hypothetical protein
MKEVTRDEYWNFIRDKNVTYNVVGDYPFTGYWKDRWGNIVAKRVDSYPEDGVYPLVEKYYIQL